MIRSKEDLRNTQKVGPSQFGLAKPSDNFKLASRFGGVHPTNSRTNPPFAQQRETNQSTASGCPRHHIFLRRCSIGTYPHGLHHQRNYVARSGVPLLERRHTSPIRTLVRRSPQRPESRIRCSTGGAMPWCTTEDLLTLASLGLPARRTRTTPEFDGSHVTHHRPPKSGAKFDRAHRRLSRLP